MIEHHGLVNPDNAKMIARHEVYCTLEDIIVQTAKLLKNSGKFLSGTSTVPAGGDFLSACEVRT